MRAAVDGEAGEGGSRISRSLLDSPGLLHGLRRSKCISRIRLLSWSSGFITGSSLVTQPVKRLVEYWYQVGPLNTGTTGKLSATISWTLSNSVLALLVGGRPAIGVEHLVELAGWSSATARW